MEWYGLQPFAEQVPQPSFTPTAATASWLGGTPHFGHNTHFGSNSVAVTCGSREGIYEATVNKVFCNCPDCQGQPEPARFFSLSGFEIHGGRQAAKQPKRSIKIKEDGSTLLRWLELQLPEKPKRRSTLAKARTPPPDTSPERSELPHGELDLLAAAAGELPSAPSLPISSLGLPRSRPLSELQAEAPVTALPSGSPTPPGRSQRRRRRRRKAARARAAEEVESSAGEEEMAVESEEEEEEESPAGRTSGGDGASSPSEAPDLEELYLQRLPKRGRRHGAAAAAGRQGRRRRRRVDASPGWEEEGEELGLKGAATFWDGPSSLAPQVDIAAFLAAGEVPPVPVAHGRAGPSPSPPLPTTLTVRSQLESLLLQQQEWQQQQAQQVKAQAQAQQGQEAGVPCLMSAPVAEPKPEAQEQPAGPVAGPGASEGEKGLLQSLAMVQEGSRLVGADLQLMWLGGAAGAMPLLAHARQVASQFGLRVQQLALAGPPSALGVPVSLRVLHAGEAPQEDIQGDVMGFVDTL